VRRAASFAVVLFLSALSATPHAAAEPGACMDGFDNDFDGDADWPADPGCSGPGDPDERPCGPDRLDECFAELQPCPGMLPPNDLRATWTDHGVTLEWRAPASGMPPVYLVFRVPVLPGPSPPTDVTLAVLDQVSPNALPTALGHDVAPTTATVHLPGRGLAVVAPLDAPTALPEPIDSVPGSLTTYFDAAAEPAASYAYWVEGAGPGCRGPASNAALAGPYAVLPPNTDDCFYWDPPAPWTGPSTRCLDRIP
jgi:hypothetical protein